MNRFADLARRMRPVHASWQLAVADLTLDQVNHVEREGILPIAFSLMHLVTTEDIRGSTVLKGEPLWMDGNWAGRIGVTVPSVARGTPIDVAESLRFHDLEAWRAYQTAVFAKTDAMLATQADSHWDEIWLERVPDGMRGGFLDMLVGPNPVTVGDFCEVVLYHHGLRHLGELEHARSLVGLHGVGG
jgi:hypothetical protein